MKFTSKIFIGITAFFFTSSHLFSQDGLSSETAIPATFDTNNVFDAGNSIQYFQFKAGYSGFAVAGNCNLTSLNTQVIVYDSTMAIISINYNYCEQQSQTAFPVKSGMKYYIRWGVTPTYEDSTFYWYLSEYNPVPGEFCSLPDTFKPGPNHTFIPPTETRWFNYTAKKNENVLINTKSYMISYSVTEGCNGDQVKIHYVNDSCIAFVADSGISYALSWNNYGENEEFDVFISTEASLPGEKCETALIADTGINTFHSGVLSDLFYTYETYTSGMVTIDFCNVPADTVQPYISVYQGGCDYSSAENLIVNSGYCQNNNYNFSFYADSGQIYTMVIQGKPYYDFEWHLNQHDPFPGEIYQSAIPVNIDDTIEIQPLEYSRKLWYEFESEENKMVIISSSGLGNELSHIYSINVLHDSIEKNGSIYEPVIYEKISDDGREIGFAALAGEKYYFYMYYFIADVNNPKWKLIARDFEEGETCEISIPADRETIYTVPEKSIHVWYDYTPEQDEYMVIGCIQLQDEYYDIIQVKQDCECSSEVYAGSECSSVNQTGMVFFLEAGIQYHIGWEHNDPESAVSWAIYNPTEIMDFSIGQEILPADINHDNHTIDITVSQNTSVTDLVPEFLEPSSLYYYIDEDHIYPGLDEIDFSQPVTITVKYIDDVRGDTLSQDWVITVRKEDSGGDTYTVKSNYLINPELNKTSVTHWADFWKSAYDDERGGFFTNMDKTGNPLDDQKSVLSQSRNAYAFARAFMISGDTTYLSYADRALQYMYLHLWDDTNGGWYSSVNNNGSLYADDNYNTYKWSFMQHYANLGIVAMIDAVGGARFSDESLQGEAFDEHIHWQKLNNSLDIINEFMWDEREDYYGYYYQTDLDWGNPSGKGFTPTVDGITTHGLYMYLLTKDPFFENRFEQLADNIEEHLIPGMNNAEIGFPEAYTSDWEMESDGDMFIGHMFKTAWCLARAYLVNPKEDYRNAAKVLMYDLLNNGTYDYFNGAPYTSYDWASGYINKNTKSWWDVEQAYNSGIMNYYISDENNNKRYKYLEVADGSIDFFMNHFVDEENGEVYSTTDREGNPQDDQKGSFWKAGYHSTEFAYYAYLYGNLFYKEEPVDLYYFIDKSDHTQSVSLYPLAIEDHFLKIDAVELEGVPFDDFNPDTRTLSIPSNTGGIFKVTFSNQKFIDGLYEPLTDNTYGLDVRVYPNPLSNTGIIEYTLNNLTDVSIQILDIAGRVIYVTENKNAAPGAYQEYIDRTKLGENNVCFIRVKTNTQSMTTKLILLD